MNRLRSLISARKRLFVTLGGILIVLFSGLLVSQSFAAPFSRYQAYRDAIVTLRELEANFNQEILKSRYELFASYDALVQNLLDQETLHAQLSDIPRFVNARDRRELNRIIQERSTALTQKEDLSEWFKSRNALLKNSLRYLPLLTQQIEASFEAAPPPTAATTGSASAATPNTPADPATAPPAPASATPEETLSETPAETATPPTGTALTAAQTATLRGTLNQLIRNLLLYNASGEDGLADRAETLAQQLAQLENTLEIPEETLPTKVFRAHANVILTTKPLVEELTGQLLLPLEQYTDGLETTLERAYGQAGRRASLFRLINLGWLLLLLGGANVLFIRRFRQADPALDRYQRQVATLAETAHQLQSGSARPEQTAQLAPFLERQDDLGQLAHSLQHFRAKLQQTQQASQEEAFAFLSARLNLLTKNRRQLMAAEAAMAVRTALETSLAQQDCELLELQLETDQVSLQFTYPLSISLAQLVKTLKQAATVALQSEAIAPNLPPSDAEALWSDAYLIASCPPPAQEATGGTLASQGNSR